MVLVSLGFLLLSLIFLFFFLAFLPSASVIIYYPVFPPSSTRVFVLLSLILAFFFPFSHKSFSL